MQHIVLGLSGGPDSVCLFHILLRLRQTLGLRLHPVHVNHGLRPGAVGMRREPCGRTFLPGARAFLQSDRSRLSRTCRSMAYRPSEEAGRKLRYDAFYDEARQIAEKLAAEHGGSPGRFFGTYQDRCGSQCGRSGGNHPVSCAARYGDRLGLAGIAYERKERGFSVIRPILDIPRKEIEEYCREHDLSPGGGSYQSSEHLYEEQDPGS